MQTALSLVTQGDWDVSEYLHLAPEAYGLAVRLDEPTLPYCVQRQAHGVYSTYPAGMVSFALPAALIARLAGADLHDSKVQERLEKWVAEITDVRRETAFSEELSMDAIFLSDGDIDAQLTAHGLPRLLLTTREVFKKRRLETKKFSVQNAPDSIVVWRKRKDFDLIDNLRDVLK